MIESPGTKCFQLFCAIDSRDFDLMQLQQLNGDTANATSGSVNENGLAGCLTGPPAIIPCRASIPACGMAAACSKVIPGDLNSRAFSGAQTKSANPPKPQPDRSP